MLNRSVVIVRAKEPFRRWLAGLPDPIEESLEAINQDSTVFLLPDIDCDDESEDVLGGFFEAIFEQQLAAWWQNEADWPVPRNATTFAEWFDLGFHSHVLDLVDEPLLDDE